MTTQKYKKVASTLSTNNRSVRMRGAAPALLNDTLGVATISIKEEFENCPDQIFTPNDITVTNTKERLKDKSYFFGNEDIKIINNELILPFQDSDFFNYNYGPWSGNLINYGGIFLSVWFLPNGTKIDDVRYVGLSDDCKYSKEQKIIPGDVIMFSTTADRKNQERAGFIDVPIENIGNYTGKNGIRLFVTVIQMYSTTPIGSFYID